MPHITRSEGRPSTRLAARHLARSRHGILYFRWVVPAALRERFPQLPRELKRSSGTSNVRVATQFARDLLGQCLSRLTLDHPYMPRSPADRLDAILGGLFKSPAGNSSSAVDSRLATPMVIERDPVTRRITRIETHPHDTPQAVELIGQMLRDEREAERAQRLADSSAIASVPTVQPPAASFDIGSSGPSKRWLGDAITSYLEHLARKGKHSENTLFYTHAPSLRLFRELISDKRLAFGPDGVDGNWDIALGDITPDRLDNFVACFWKFPARQGKRPAHADAKELLVSGGEAQSRDNVLKRLKHIQGLLSWLAARSEVDAAVPDRLQAELAGMVNDSREGSGQALDYGDGDDGTLEEDGYVAFSADDRKRLFHPQVYAAHAAGDAARYWIPVLARFTGCRLNEIAQASVRDVRTLGGIPCLFVTSFERDANGQVVPVEERKKRVKTKAGRRTIPLHSEVLRLGFLDFVEERRKGGGSSLFDLKWFAKDGFGKYPGRDFSLLSKAVGVWERKRKVFHSFRATINQELEAADLDGTLIDRFLGHSVHTVREKHYNRNREGQTLPLRRVFEALSRIPAGIEIPSWNEVRAAPRRHLKSICVDLGFTSAFPHQKIQDS